MEGAESGSLAAFPLLHLQNAPRDWLALLRTWERVICPLSTYTTNCASLTASASVFQFLDRSQSACIGAWDGAFRKHSFFWRKRRLSCFREVVEDLLDFSKARVSLNWLQNILNGMRFFLSLSLKGEREGGWIQSGKGKENTLDMWSFLRPLFSSESSFLYFRNNYSCPHCTSRKGACPKCCEISGTKVRVLSHRRKIESWSCLFNFKTFFVSLFFIFIFYKKKLKTKRQLKWVLDI